MVRTGAHPPCIVRPAAWRGLPHSGGRQAPLEALVDGPDVADVVLGLPVEPVLGDPVETLVVRRHLAPAGAGRSSRTPSSSTPASTLSRVWRSFSFRPAYSDIQVPVPGSTCMAPIASALEVSALISRTPATRRRARASVAPRGGGRCRRSPGGRGRGGGARYAAASGGRPGAWWRAPRGGTSGGLVLGLGSAGRPSIAGFYGPCAPRRGPRGSRGAARLGGRRCCRGGCARSARRSRRGSGRPGRSRCRRA